MDSPDNHLLSPVPCIEKLSGRIDKARFELGLRLVQGFFVKEVLIEGGGNLTALPTSKPTVIAVSHISDADVLIAASTLAPHFRDLVITNQSTQYNGGEPPLWAGMRLLGLHHFLPISYGGPQGARKGHFEPKDFEAMRSALSRGSTLLVAAHEPSFGIMSQKPGLAAPYLSFTCSPGVTVVPVGVRMDYPIKAENFTRDVLRRGRPSATVHIGAPFECTEYSGLNGVANRAQMSTLLGEKLESIMRRVAEVLPQENRGPW